MQFTSPNCHLHLVLQCMLQVVSSVCKVVHLQPTSLQHRAFLHCTPCNADVSAPGSQFRACLQCRPCKTHGANDFAPALQMELPVPMSKKGFLPTHARLPPSSGRWQSQISCWHYWHSLALSPARLRANRTQLATCLLGLGCRCCLEIFNEDWETSMDSFTQFFNVCCTKLRSASWSHL